MMNGNMLDTNVIIKLVNAEQTAVEFFEDLHDIKIPATVVGELCFGAYKSARKQDNISLFTSFISSYQIVHIDATVAHTYGKLKVNLIKNGVNLPENDIWIAATAITHHYTLITFDVHFKHIENLHVIFLQ